jgi:hypothetical protein
MGLFHPGGNRAAQAEDMGNSKEEFAVFWQEKRIDIYSIFLFVA